MKYAKFHDEIWQISLEISLRNPVLVHEILQLSLCKLCTVFCWFQLNPVDFSEFLVDFMKSCEVLLDFMKFCEIMLVSVKSCLML